MGAQGSVIQREETYTSSSKKVFNILEEVREIKRQMDKPLGICPLHEQSSRKEEKGLLRLFCQVYRKKEIQLQGMWRRWEDANVSTCIEVKKETKEGAPQLSHAGCSINARNGKIY